MNKRYVGVSAVVVGLGLLGVIGTVGGGYLADRTASRQVDSLATRTGGDSRTSTGPGGTSSGPGRSESPETRPATYQINRLIYDQASTTVMLVSAETTGGKLRLVVRYRNSSLLPWPLTCPAADADLTSSHIGLSDGRTVYPESTWCATTRAGETFTVAPGEQLTTWAVFPAAPAAGSSFALTWYDFPGLSDVQLR